MPKLAPLTRRTSQRIQRRILIAEAVGISVLSLVVIGLALSFGLERLRSAPPAAAPATAAFLSPTSPSLASAAPPLSPPASVPTAAASPTLEPLTPALTPSPDAGPTLLPAPAVITYTVVAGDTLSGIATSFGLTLDELVGLNDGLDPTAFLQIGQVLIVRGPAPVEPDLSLTLTPPPAGATTSAPLPTATPALTTSPGTDSYTVYPGDTLAGIANLYGVEPQAIRNANGMYGDALLPYQSLSIPLGAAPERPSWRYSILQGNLPGAYASTYSYPGFSLHLTPGSYPAGSPETLAGLVQQGLAHIETVFQGPLSGSFDVYVAGSLFEPPNLYLRGRSFSANRQTFFLHDGTGNAADQQYIAAHELTHLYTWNTFGIPASTLVSEGAAVYAGLSLITPTSNHLPLDTFCAIYLQDGSLPWVSSGLAYSGHIYDLENYYAAGCFVGYLVETYGPASFGRLYPTENYSGIYGRSLTQLEQDWRAALAYEPVPAGIDPGSYIAAVEEIESAYRRFFASFYAAESQLAAYRYLDQARLALLEGRLSEVSTLLAEFEAAR